MKINPLKTLKFCSSLIIALLALIIFTPACQEETEYYPSARFVLKGTVLSDSVKEPLKDILVVMYHETKALNPLFVDSLDIFIDSGLTDSVGYFQVTDSLGIPAEVVYNLAFIDMGNELKASVPRVNFTSLYKFENPVFTNGDGRWYSGEVIKVATFTMKAYKE